MREFCVRINVITNVPSCAPSNQIGSAFLRMNSSTSRPVEDQRPFDSFLFEDGHIFFPAPSLLRLLSRKRFSPGLFHAGHLLGLMPVQLQRKTNKPF